MCRITFSLASAPPLLSLILSVWSPVPFDELQWIVVHVCTYFYQQFFLVQVLSALVLCLVVDTSFYPWWGESRLAAVCRENNTIINK